MKKVLFISAGVAVAYVVVELFSLFALFAAINLKPSAFLPEIGHDYFSGLDEGDLRAYLNGNYDAVLGWDHKPGSEATSKNCLGEFWTESFDVDGARSTLQTFDTTLIATYGDSYVKGGELNNDQTWQVQLASQLETNVKNFAVGAFDPYQALLKMKRHFGQGNVYPITVLGINEQNVTRVVNLYRPFLYDTARTKLAFKPGLACNDAQCVPIGNLLRPDASTIDDVVAQAHVARQWDYWARTKPSFEYPWSLNLLKLGRLAFTSLTADESDPLWFAPEGAAAMHYVVSQFRDAVQEAGSQPVILFIPTKPKSGGLPSYRRFKQRIKIDYPELIVLDVADSDFDTAKFKLKPSGACHPSEYGHGVIARTVRVGLGRLLAEKTAETFIPNEIQ